MFFISFVAGVSMVVGLAFIILAILAIANYRWQTSGKIVWF